MAKVARRERGLPVWSRKNGVSLMSHCILVGRDERRGEKKIGEKKGAIDIVGKEAGRPSQGYIFNEGATIVQNSATVVLPQT